MNRLTELKPLFTEEIPEQKEHGILYVSEKYEVSVHLCACGCGEKTVLPFTKMPQSWEYIRNDDMVTFRPSIGNWQVACKSHYYIVNNKIQWL